MARQATSQGNDALERVAKGCKMVRKNTGMLYTGEMNMERSREGANWLPVRVEASYMRR